VRDHSKEIHDLEKRLEKVLNNALDVKEDEITNLRHRDHVHWEHIDQLADQVRRSQERAETILLWLSKERNVFD